jgi:hypothetical protein
MQKAKSTHVFLLVTLLFIGLMGCTEKESLEPIGNMAVGLDSVREVWVKQGRSNNFDPNNAVRSSVEHYYAFTNEISVAGQIYHCRFAVRSQLIHTPGAMAITDDGICLWIYDKDGKVIVSPQKNGIERVDQ